MRSASACGIHSHLTTGCCCISRSWSAHAIGDDRCGRLWSAALIEEVQRSIAA
ncbi:hypothetical protein XMIN_2859 [Xanthomonas citri pv. mangiferaeindicae LMG 941]|nr:hypothetical protein XMIN_2859 [Xanthomonas citri pv. mangiferaeindicae LMG 941]